MCLFLEANTQFKLFSPHYDYTTLGNRTYFSSVRWLRHSLTSFGTCGWTGWLVKLNLSKFSPNNWEMLIEKNNFSIFKKFMS